MAREGTGIKLKTFPSLPMLERAVLALLTEHMKAAGRIQRAVMLPGGRTPLNIYKAIEMEPFAVHHSFHLLLSDERLVPLSSADSNYGSMAGMVRALCIDESRILRVHTELPSDEAAYLYNKELASFIIGGGRITLGLLGLGADGHTASLFSTADVSAGTGKYAVAVKRPHPPVRVSVTQELLSKVERLVFMAAGSEKADAVERLINRPASIPAGLATANAANVEIWYARQL